MQVIVIIVKAFGKKKTYLVNKIYEHNTTNICGIFYKPNSLV